MKQFLICLCLILFTSFSYGEFKYRKDQTYNKCKAHIIACNSNYRDLENAINEFCNDKKILDLKYQHVPNVVSVLIVYTEED